MTTRARQIVLAARPKGRPELTDFRLEERPIPTPWAGQLLLEVKHPCSLTRTCACRMNHSTIVCYATRDRGRHERRNRGARAGLKPFPQGGNTDGLPVTMRQILSKRLTVRGFINYDFAAEHYPDFLRDVGAGIAAGRIRYREDIVDGLENAPGAFIGMLEGRNFGKLIVRVAA